jgi:hypothetical protein
MDYIAYNTKGCFDEKFVIIATRCSTRDFIYVEPGRPESANTPARHVTDLGCLGTMPSVRALPNDILIFD